MENTELLEVLLRINNSREESIDEKIIEQILAIVMLNPLPEDRLRSQDQLLVLVNQKIR